MKNNIIRLITLSASLCVSSGLQAAFINVIPTADGSVKTFGGDLVITNDIKIDLSQSGQNITNSILEFDLSFLNPASISSARLDLTLTRFITSTSTTAAIHVFAYNGDGIVDILDYAAPGTEVVNTTTLAGGGAGDVRSFVFSDLVSINDSLTNGLLSLRIETDSFAGIQFSSLENTSFSAANLQLDVSPVPVPAAVWLFGSGLIGLIGLARRKT